MRAAAEVRVAELRTEVSGLEAAIARRRPSAGLPSSKNSPDLLRFGGSPQFGLSDADSAVAGVAALVVLLMELHRDWATKKRATAVELVLLGASKPLHRSDITETLHRVGRPKDNLRDVSAALAYLHRINKVKPVGDGMWVHAAVINPIY